MKLNRITALAAVLIAMACFAPASASPTPEPVAVVLDSDASTRAKLEEANPLPDVTCPDGSKPSAKCIEQFREARNKKIHKANTELSKKLKKNAEDRKARLAALTEFGNPDSARKIADDFIVGVLIAHNEHDHSVTAANNKYKSDVLANCCDQQQKAVRWTPAFPEDELVALLAAYPLPTVVCPDGSKPDADCADAYAVVRNNKIRNANTKLAKKSKELVEEMRLALWNATTLGTGTGQSTLTIQASFIYQMGEAQDAHDASIKDANDAYSASVLLNCCDQP